MPRIPIQRSTAAIGAARGDTETARIHWRKGANPRGLEASDWLLIPLNPSDLISGDHPFFRQPVAELTSVIKALDALRSWLKEQPTAFSLESAAAGCFQITKANLTPDIQAGLQLLLEDLGCTPVEKRTTASRSWYLPPPQPALTVKTGRGPPGNGTQDAKGYPVAPSHEIYRMGAVVKLSGLSRSSIYRLEALGLFPGRVKLSGSAVGWRSDEIHSWIASRKAAGEKEER